MNINIVIDAYAAGKITQKRLEKTLRLIGYSPRIVVLLLRKANYKKDKVQNVRR